MIVAIDTETFLIKPGMMAPKLVCVSTATEKGSDLWDGVDYVSKLLCSDDIIVGHNIRYDFGVICAERPELLPLIFSIYEQGRVRDTQIRQKLIDIATGQHKFRYDENGTAIGKTSHSLAALAALHLGIKLEKTDTYRLRYAELAGRPFSDWPQEAIDYALKDAEITLKIFNEQKKFRLSETYSIPDEAYQTKFAWPLQLMSIWGLRTDPIAVEVLGTRLEKICSEAWTKLKELGIIRVTGSKKHPKESKDIEAIRKRVVEAYKDPPKTKKDQISTSRATLSEAKDDALQLLANTSGDFKLLNTYIPLLRKGAEVPICASYNELVETGRTSCREPNLQNLPRKHNVRECIIPRKGYVFVACDYNAAELRALAQICLDFFGESVLAQQFKAGEKPPVNFAAALLGISRQEALERFAKGDPEVKAKRQLAKAALYGYPGGMMPRKFIVTAKAQEGLILTLEESTELRNAWLREYPEMKKYLNKAREDVNGNVGFGTVRHVRTGRIRGHADYKQIANSYFQGLTADFAKLALWNVSKECYLDAKSPLYNSRIVWFAHDEIAIEAPESGYSEAADKLSFLMRTAGETLCPDVPIETEVVAMRRWYKNASSTKVDGKWTIYDGGK